MRHLLIFLRIPSLVGTEDARLCTSGRHQRPAPACETSVQRERLLCIVPVLTEEDNNGCTRDLLGFSKRLLTCTYTTCTAVHQQPFLLQRRYKKQQQTFSRCKERISSFLDESAERLLEIKLCERFAYICECLFLKTPNGHFAV